MMITEAILKTTDLQSGDCGASFLSLAEVKNSIANSCQSAVGPPGSITKATRMVGCFMT